MGKNDKKAKKKKGGKSTADEGDEWITVDPSRIRFQHARIRPLFSGCSRPVEQTLTDIREGKLKPEDLPPIQVIVGPEEDGERWYFSLNNRRLWVLKRCREEGLLQNNQIRVRWRQPKSTAEAQRYTLEKCALEAKFIREPNTKTKQTVVEDVEDLTDKIDELVVQPDPDKSKSHEVMESEEDEDSSDDDDDTGNYANPFSALM
jgi:hypothetical protein